MGEPIAVLALRRKRDQISGTISHYEKLLEPTDDILRLEIPKTRPAQPLTHGMIKAEKKKSRSLYIFGSIKYRDAIDTWHRMTFCRRYDADSKRFLPVDDPEYEYDE